jgi:hypothetical protein
MTGARTVKRISQNLRDRVRTHRAAAKLRRHERVTAAGHLISVGLTPKQARSAGATLKKNAAKTGVQGTAGVSYAKRVPARPCTRYTVQEAAVAAASWRPRNEEYKAAKAALLARVGS